MMIYGAMMLKDGKKNTRDVRTGQGKEDMSN